MLLSSHAARDGRVRVYRRATVVDGTGAPRYEADVAVEAARIVAIERGPVGELPEGAIEIDARGLALAPGFIDMHAHSDLAVLHGAAHDAKILQGVTTEVLGQDGIGYAPVDDAAAPIVATQIAGWNGPVDPETYSWRGMGEYLERVDAATVANAAVLVPQGNLRLMTVGYDDRPATAGELDRMRGLLVDGLLAGAFGMSSGLTYAPGMYADTDELAALATVVAEFGGFWAPHTRGYGRGALAAYREALDIGRRTGCAIHLTHATMNFSANRGRASELLSLIDDALADGVDVTLDTYPYLPGATTLSALLPSALAAGGDLLGALRRLTPGDRERLRIEVDELGCDGFHGEPADWALIQVTGVASSGLDALVGRTIAEIADEQGKRPIDVVVDTLIDDELATGVLMHIGDEDNVREIMRHPAHSGGSDGILIGGRPHPRARGTFPRYLGHYARDLGVLTLEEAVRHLSGIPARRLGLDRGEAPRGVIREGAIADLVLFDPAAVRDLATFDEPRRAPVGIAEVLVAGTPVVVGGAVTGATPGRALRHALPPHRATLPLVERTPDRAVGQGQAGEDRSFALRPGLRVIAPDSPEVGARLAADFTAALGFEVPLDADADGSAGEIILTIDPDVPEHGGPGLAGSEAPGDEAFRLEVGHTGIRLRGASPAGLFRAGTVLRQLLPPEAWAPIARTYPGAENGPDGGGFGQNAPRFATSSAVRGGHAATPAWSIPLGEWSGAPAYPWRGLMLDVARHFRPVDDVLRLIDLMAMHHLSVLHLHLTDDQGWRYEVPGWPLLTEVGGRRTSTQRGHGARSSVVEGAHEGWYTTADLRRIAAYAAERFITVVPEVELPGHVQAALAAYPELGDGDAPDGPWPRFGINTRTLNLEAATLQFCRDAIDALVDVFPSPWIGIGGDEVPTQEWAASPAAGERMAELGLATAAEVQSWFTRELSAHVRARGHRPFAWDEVLAGADELDPSLTVAAWRGPAAARAARERGLDVVACPDLWAYLDYRQSDGPDEPVQVGPPLTLAETWLFDAGPGALGGQANAWTEHLSTRDRLDFAIFPRLAAIAERLWRGGDPGDFAEFARRLATHERRWDAAGVAYRPSDGPRPAQRTPGVPGKPISRAERERIVEKLVEDLE